VEFKASTLLGEATSVSFERAQFEVDGKLPAPAF